MLAKDFKGVWYSYHRDLFALLGEEEISAAFADIWGLCEPYMKGDTLHRPQVQKRPPEYWVGKLDPGFRAELAQVLEDEAEGDEKRGRKVLAKKLRHIVGLLRIT